MSITTIFFDMGGTLLRYHPPDSNWEGMEKRGAAGLYEALSENGHNLPPRETVLQEWWEANLHAWRSLRTIPKEELRVASQIRLLAEKLGLTLTGEDVAVAERAYVDAIQPTVRPLPGALDAVQWVKEQGLNVGLISNTIWRGEHHQEDLERYGFWEYFEHTIFSSDALMWKPEPAIFESALAVFDARPGEAIYVGDSLFFDVYGAQEAGWRAIWVEQPRRWMPPDMAVPTPDATLKDMTTFKEIFSNWL